MPLWMLIGLMRNLDRLQAEEALRAATITQMPYMDEHQRRRIIRRWQRLANPPQPSVPPEVIEENPEKARRYFARMGAVIVESDTGNVASENVTDVTQEEAS